MIGLYRPKILLLDSVGSEFLKKIFLKEKVDFLLAKNPNEAKNKLAQANIDIIVATMDQDSLNLSDFFLKVPSNISIIAIDALGGIVPKDWKESCDIFLRKKTAQESLIKICFDLLDQGRNLKKAA
jgi:hypothetical protein